MKRWNFINKLDTEIGSFLRRTPFNVKYVSNAEGTKGESSDENDEVKLIRITNKNSS